MRFLHAILPLFVIGLLTLPAAGQSPAREQGLTVQKQGQPTQRLTLESLGSMRAVTQRVMLTTGRGEQGGDWSGPLLWDVLVAAGAVDEARPMDHVRLVVRVTGSDGYVAVFAGGELSPQFAARPVQIAIRLDGAPIANAGLRLVVPGERRAGRSVRDVVRIDLE